MFVRTRRLTLRPAWPEDAAEIAQAIGHEVVARNLARVPWPYPIEAAKSFAAGFDDPTEPKFLIFAHAGGACRLAGAMSIGRLGDEAHELGYWLTPEAWGRGYATEAGAAVLHAARSRGIRRVAAGHFLDNPASGRVLRKLGFRATGRIVPMYSQGRGGEAPSARFEIDLDDKLSGADPDARMAA